MAVSYRQGAIVWSGYEENQDFKDQYHSNSQVWVYSSLTKTWTCKLTKGDIPSKCSGAAATVIGELSAAGILILITINNAQEIRCMSLPAFTRLWSTSELSEVCLLIPLMTKTKLQKSTGCPVLRFPTVFGVSTSSPGSGPNSNLVANLRCNATKQLPGLSETRQTPEMISSILIPAVFQVFLFGGFGPPPDSRTIEKAGSTFEFCEDSSTSNSVYTRGWSNQLVCYDTLTNRWEWPLCSGQPPSPRAAHSVAVVNDIAYVFGGRHLNTRINDLYSLDLLTMKWNLVLSDSNAENIPVGRSWQTMTALATGEKEGGLLLYGGFDNNLQALGDCWRMDLSQHPQSWVRCPHLEQGPRLWHAAVDIDPSTVIIIGGLTNNILAPAHVSKHHAEAVLSLGVAPPSLLKLCLEFITSKKEMFSKEVEELPQYLKKIVKIRCSSGA